MAPNAVPDSRLFFTAGVGIGTLFPALKERWSRPVHPSDDNVSELEQRLAAAESELAATTSELLHLKQSHDFDLKLRLSQPSRESAPLLPRASLETE